MNFQQFRTIAACIALLCLFWSACDEPVGPEPSNLLKEWQPDVPNGGRVVAMAVHPTDDRQIIVASETGGLFRSNDEGNQFQHTSDTATFTFNDVMYSPIDPTVILATAWRDTRTNSGGGIWRSTNGGLTWEQVHVISASAAERRNSEGFCLSWDADRSRLWVATQYGLVFSDDNGATWRPLRRLRRFTWAILTPTGQKMRAVASNGLYVSENGGTTWARKPLLVDNILATPIPRPAHNPLVVSPLNPDHLFWATHAAFPDTVRRGLYFSPDNGDNWTTIWSDTGTNRPPFVAATLPLPDAPDQYRIYFSDGFCTLLEIDVTGAINPVIGTPRQLTIDHCDHTEVAFRNDSVTPLLIGSDGGIHRLVNDEWKMIGGKASGYGALQITEVTGQTDGQAPSDLYFGTQDNNIWASVDEGESWGGSICCEGFFLQVLRQRTNDAGNKITGNRCGPCNNFIADRHNFGDFPYEIMNNPPNSPAGTWMAPTLIRENDYIMPESLPGTVGNFPIGRYRFYKTTNLGTNWRSAFSMRDPIQDLPKVSGQFDQVVYMPVRQAPPAGFPAAPYLTLKRVDAVNSGSGIVSDVSGASLAYFPTMFPWYVPYAVHPLDPERLIVADSWDAAVKITTNGGFSWDTLTNLTTMIGDSGRFPLIQTVSRGFARSQVSALAFDPVCEGHIMVGTHQRGVFESYNDGQTWSSIPGSDVLFQVSRFYFSEPGEVYISTYGRGMWRYTYRACRVPERLPRQIVPDDPRFRIPELLTESGLVEMSNLELDPGCKDCGFYVIRKGEILDFEVDSKTGEIKSVLISKGSKLAGFDISGSPLKAPFEVKFGDKRGKMNEDKYLAEILSKVKTDVMGLYVKGNQLQSVILAPMEISQKQLPRPKKPVPRIFVDIPPTGLHPDRLGSTFKIYGTNWKDSGQIELVLDGTKLDVEQQLKLDQNGNFVLTLPLPLLGEIHSLLATQSSKGKSYRDILSFHYRVSDKE